MAVKYTEPNPNKWGERSYSFYQALQLNLGKVERVYFVTLSFLNENDGGLPRYENVRSQLRQIVRNAFLPNGFQVVSVVSLHPKDGRPSRLHVHCMAWSTEERSTQKENLALARVREIAEAATYKREVEKDGRKEIEEGKCIGKYELERVQHFTRVAAYLAYNYDQSLKQNREQTKQIPKGARLVSAPEFVSPGKVWDRVGRSKLVTDQSIAWRLAVAEYARKCGVSENWSLKWIWCQKEQIKELLAPQQWRQASVCGMDGHTYLVCPYGLDARGNESYLLTSEERGSFILNEEGLKELGKLDIMANTLPKGDNIDLFTGDTVIWKDIWGMKFPCH